MLDSEVHGRLETSFYDQKALVGRVFSRVLEDTLQFSIEKEIALGLFIDE